MHILISCAKTMANKVKPLSNGVVTKFTTPKYLEEASKIALYMSQLTVDELETLLSVNNKIAVQNFKRYQVFHDQTNSIFPAISAYTGAVFKRIAPEDLSIEELLYAQRVLHITSFCYGLLRPLDCIKPYRLEGSVQLPHLCEGNLFEFWRDKLTADFVNEVKETGGQLCYLASEEMKRLFEWKRVENELKVVTPEFKVLKNGRWKTIVIYTKMCRGEMARFIVQNKITHIEELKTFQWEGFVYNESLSTASNLVFTSGQML